MPLIIQILTLLQQTMWHILNAFLSHFATFVDYPPISTLYTNIFNPQILMRASSLKLNLGHLILTTTPFCLINLNVLAMSCFCLSSLTVVLVHFSVLMYKQTFRLTQFDLSSAGFQLIWLKITLVGTSKFSCTLEITKSQYQHCSLHH